jgi:hypothetical protein
MRYAATILEEASARYNYPPGTAWHPFLLRHEAEHVEAEDNERPVS